MNYALRPCKVTADERRVAHPSALYPCGLLFNINIVTVQNLSPRTFFNKGRWHLDTHATDKMTAFLVYDMVAEEQMRRANAPFSFFLSPLTQAIQSDGSTF